MKKPIIQIEHQDYKFFSQSIPDNTIDAVIIDPPYTDGKSDALPGHKIFKDKLNLEHCISEAVRILKPEGYFVYFGQMPTIHAWNSIAFRHNDLFFADQIIWVKGTITAVFLPIVRGFETFMIFSKGKKLAKKYFTTKANFEDVSLPKYLQGLLDIKTVHNAIQEARRALATGEPNIRKRHNKQTTNDPYYKKYSKNKSEKSFFDPINLTNVWSFAEYDGISIEPMPQVNDIPKVWRFKPHNHIKSKDNTIQSNINHPTVKPIQLMKRIIELTTAEPNDLYTPTIVDFFSGSGTTALACVETKRNFLGCEIDADYHKLSTKRVQRHLEIFGMMDDEYKNAA